MKNVSALLIVMVILTMFSTSAFADTNGVGGFYDIATKDNVEIRPFAGDMEVGITSKDLNGDAVNESFYENSERLEVKYSAAVSGSYYGVLLIEGSALPTKDTYVYFIDQVDAKSSVVDFNVYPILPDKTTDMTLYISSNAPDEELVKIALNYATNVTEDITSYVLGDVNDDGAVNTKDRMTLARHLANWDSYDTINTDAADVNADNTVNTKDRMTLARHLANWDGYETLPYTK